MESPDAKGLLRHVGSALSLPRLDSSNSLILSDKKQRTDSNASLPRVDSLTFLADTVMKQMNRRQQQQRTNGGGGGGEGSSSEKTTTGLMKRSLSANLGYLLHQQRKIANGGNASPTHSVSSNSSGVGMRRVGSSVGLNLAEIAAFRKGGSRESAMYSHSPPLSSANVANLVHQAGLGATTRRTTTTTTNVSSEANPRGNRLQRQHYLNEGNVQQQQQQHNVVSNESIGLPVGRGGGGGEGSASRSESVVNLSLFETSPKHKSVSRTSVPYVLATSVASESSKTKNNYKSDKAAPKGSTRTARKRKKKKGEAGSDEKIRKRRRGRTKEESKAMHRLVERRRTRRINDVIEALKIEALTAEERADRKKCDKVSVLESSLRVIRQLKRRVAQLEGRDDPSATAAETRLSVDVSDESLSSEGLLSRSTSPKAPSTDTTPVAE